MHDSKQEGDETGIYGRQEWPSRDAYRPPSAWSENETDLSEPKGPIIP
jgi:hypothetical protein